MEAGPAAEPTVGAKRTKRTPEEVKALFLAYFETGEGPEEVGVELAKYYRRTYINPAGPKHEIYLEWQKEYQGVPGIVYLPSRRA